MKSTHTLEISDRGKNPGKESRYTGMGTNTTENGPTVSERAMESTLSRMATSSKEIGSRE